MTPSDAAALAVFTAAGTALGAIFWALMAWSVLNLATGRGVAGAAASAVLRHGLAAAVFAWTAGHGAAAVLAALGGFLLTRRIALAMARGGT